MWSRSVTTLCDTGQTGTTPVAFSRVSCHTTTVPNTHHMELSNINSVNQLLEANAVQPEAHTDETLFQLALEHLGSFEALKLAMALVEQLAVFHQNTRNELVESGEAERACLWAHDEALLAEALYTLKRVIID